MGRHNNESLLDADYDDPFQPPWSRSVRCDVCKQIYQSEEMWYDTPSELWVCRDWPKCRGAGYQIDIYDAKHQKGDSDQ